MQYVRGVIVKCTKNNNPKSSVGMLAERQMTRTKVFNADVTAKTVAKARLSMDNGG